VPRNPELLVYLLYKNRVTLCPAMPPRAIMFGPCVVPRNGAVRVMPGADGPYQDGRAHTEHTRPESPRRHGTCSAHGCSDAPQRRRSLLAEVFEAYRFTVNVTNGVNGRGGVSLPQVEGLEPEAHGSEDARAGTVELMLGVAVTVAGYVAALLTVWVRERHRKMRIVKVALRLPPGSRYMEYADGVVIEIGWPTTDELPGGKDQHECCSR
jgi:hypothetical protein